VSRQWVVPGLGQFDDRAGADDWVDGYNEDNTGSTITLYDGSIEKVGQEVQPGGIGEPSGILTRAQFWMWKVGSPPGSAVATLYLSDGSSPAEPTGSILATSQSVSASSVGAGSWIEFSFTDEYEVLSATDYFICVEYGDGIGDIDNHLRCRADNVSPTHSGNMAIYSSGSWTGFSGQDLCFHLFLNRYGVTSREWIAPGWGQIHEVGSPVEGTATIAATSTLTATGTVVAGDATDYLEDAILDHTIDGTSMAQPSAVYVGLHSADPTDTGGVGEISGGSYSRQVASSWAAASGGSKATSGAIVFTGLPATTINGYVIWDASSGGNALYTSHGLGTGITVAANDEIEFASGDITVTLD
jgi:hypothetical protein